MSKHRSTARRTLALAGDRMVSQSFDALTALLVFNSAVQVVAYPLATPAEYALVEPIMYAWAAQYALGGLLLLSGVALRLPNLEAAGCALTIAGSLTNAAALVYLFRWDSWNGALVMLALAAAAAARLYRILRGRVTLVAKVEAGRTEVA